MSSGAYPSDYQYAPAECDVRSSSALEAFRAKRDGWLNWLQDDQYHAISRQISGMLWSDAVVVTGRGETVREGVWRRKRV